MAGPGRLEMVNVTGDCAKAVAAKIQPAQIKMKNSFMAVKTFNRDGVKPALSQRMPDPVIRETVIDIGMNMTPYAIYLIS